MGLLLKKKRKTSLKKEIKRESVGFENYYINIRKKNRKDIK